MKSIFTCNFLRTLALGLTMFFGAQNHAIALNAGDLAIIGHNSDPLSGNSARSDELTIIALASIPSGTTIYISDFYWDATNVRWGNDGNNGTTLNQVEGIITWTTTSTIAAGTIFNILLTGGTNVGPVAPTISGLPGTVSLSGWAATASGAVATTGDNWFIYQGANAQTPSTWIFGWCNGVATAVSSNYSWQTNNASILGNVSMLPAGLTNGVNAISLAQIGSASAFNPHYDNNVYNTGGLRVGTKASILSAICTTSNWIGDETTPYDISTTSAYYTGANAFIVTVPLPPAEMDITGKNITIADGAVSTTKNNDTYFGELVTSGGSVSKVFTIKNTGSSNLTLSGSVTSSSVDFVVTRQPAATILPGDTTSFQIKFDPSTNSLVSSNISVANNDPDENPYNFTVSGLGLFSRTVRWVNNTGATRPATLVYEGATLNVAAATYTSVQSALNSASTNDVIYVTNGRYVNPNISTSTNCSFVGTSQDFGLSIDVNSKSGIIITSETGDFRTSSARLVGYGFVIRGGSNITIKGLIMDSVRVNGFWNSNCCSYLPTSDVRIINNQVKNTVGHGVKTDSWASVAVLDRGAWEISGNCFENIGYYNGNGFCTTPSPVSALWLAEAGRSFYISNNTIKNTRWAGVLCDGFGAYDATPAAVTIDGNCISQTVDAGVQVGFSTGNFYTPTNAFITNNTFSNCNTSSKVGIGAITILNSNVKGVKIIRNDVTSSFNGLAIEIAGWQNSPDTTYVRYNNFYSLSGGFGVTHIAGISPNGLFGIGDDLNMYRFDNNYWGDASGPTYVTNPSGTGVGLRKDATLIGGGPATYSINDFNYTPFWTSANSLPSIVCSACTTPPTVTTATQSSVTTTSAILGGDVTSGGSGLVTDRGVVWATTATPTVLNNKVQNGSGLGSFSQTVGGLPSNTQIYVRAYAINSGGISYGNQISFNTLSACSMTASITSNISATCIAGANGSLTVTQSGGAANFNYVWSNGSSAIGSPSSTNTLTGLAPNTYSVTITDGNGCTATANATVIAVDNIFPTITCPANISVNNTSGLCGAIVTYTAPVGSDNCAGATTTQIAGLASGATFPIGVTTNTFRVTDASGNFTNCSFTVTVTDNQSPSITCPANISVNAGAGTCGATVTFTAPVGTDNCPGSTTAQIAGLASGATFPVGVTTNTFRVTDASGNFTNCSFTVTVTDNILPTITCPANISVNSTTGLCGATVTYTAPVGTDNCLGSATVQTAGLASGATFPVGVTTNTFRVTDASGNFANCSFTVTVNDNETPSITCPANISVNAAAGNCGATVTFTAPVGTDNCPGSTTLQIAGLASGATFPVGVTTNTFRVTDAAGNFANCSFTVTVTDNIFPSITCPANISVNAGAGTCGATVTFTAPVGTDNCPGSTTTQIAGLSSGATFPVGVTTNTFRVTDASGNFMNCSFTVTVIDNIFPTITCPTNISVNSTAGVCGAVVTYTSPVGTDNCAGSTTVQTTGLASGATFPVGVTTNTFRVTDAAGQQTSCSFTVTVTDLTAPNVVTQNISVQLDNSGNVSITAAQVDNGSSDACGIASMTVSPNAFSCANVGNNTVTLTVTDIYGNISSATATVTVNSIAFTPITVSPLNIAINPGQIVTYTGSAAIGVIRWYNASNVLVGTGNTFITPVLPTATTFTAKAGLNTCEGAGTTLNVTLKPTTTFGGRKAN